MKKQYHFWVGSTEITFANIDEAKTLVMHLRELAENSGMDMINSLSDFCFAVETEYQHYYDLSPNDFEKVPF